MIYNKDVVKKMSFLNQLIEKKIDESATVQNAKLALKRYEHIRLRLESHDLPQVTASYSLSPTSSNGEFSSKTENYVEEKEELVSIAEQIVNAVNRLEPKDQEIIIPRYITNQGYITEKEFIINLGYSETQYYRRRKKALINLARALNILVYVNED